MQPFHSEYPKTIEEATALLSQHGASAKICAGGTDLLPNLKHELLTPQFVISLSRVASLRGILVSENTISIGAMTTLEQIVKDKDIQRFAPSLCDAASHVAGPQLKSMGTLGGNLCLDTRCLYYNQTYFWREALGFCLKKDGTTCHVTQTGKKCVAAASNDTATILLCLDASVDILNQDGIRQIKLKDFYLGDGIKNNILKPNDLLVTVHVPKRTTSPLKRLEGFAKLRHRESIDFPMLSIGVRFDIDAQEKIAFSLVTINALFARPKTIQTDWLIGQPLTSSTIAQLGQYAKDRCTPLTNICDDPTWRKEMIAVHIKKACEKALETTP